MRIAMIMASGSGTRMNQDIPKQFINVNDKPILIYTLEKFQHHPKVDKIMVVCLAGWEAVLEAYAKQFNITKLEWIVTGDTERQKSIKKGLDILKGTVKIDDLIMIHDGVRPLVSQEIISDLIITAEKYGNAVSALPILDQIVIKDNEVSTRKSLPRESLQVVTTPQAYRLSDIVEIYEDAFLNNRGISGSHSLNTLMHEYGKTLFFSKGSELNIKLTSVEDIDFFKAYLTTKRSNWIK